MRGISIGDIICLVDSIDREGRFAKVSWKSDDFWLRSHGGNREGLSVGEVAWQNVFGEIAKVVLREYRLVFLVEFVRFACIVQKWVFSTWTIFWSHLVRSFGPFLCFSGPSLVIMQWTCRCNELVSFRPCLSWCGVCWSAIMVWNEIMVRGFAFLEFLSEFCLVWARF